MSQNNLRPFCDIWELTITGLFRLQITALTTLSNVTVVELMTLTHEDGTPVFPFPAEFGRAVAQRQSLTLRGYAVCSHPRLLEETPRVSAYPRRQPHPWAMCTLPLRPRTLDRTCRTSTDMVRIWSIPCTGAAHTWSRQLGGLMMLRDPPWTLEVVQLYARPAKDAAAT